MILHSTVSLIEGRVSRMHCRTIAFEIGTQFQCIPIPIPSVWLGFRVIISGSKCVNIGSSEYDVMKLILVW